MRMTIGDTTTMDFFYDQYGRPFAMKHNTRILYYVLNAQGDVTRLIHGNGDGYATYHYDAWGNITYATDNEFTRDNPLRYRGYVYDEESQLYYCQSRYYDPATGRFINADDYLSTGENMLSKNTFTYCLNNPVNYADESGTFPWLIVGIIVACVAIVGIDHALAANQPEGGYALTNEQRGNGARFKGLYAKGNGFEMDYNGITLCDTEVGVVSTTFENEYATIEPVDCLTASATAEVDWSGMPSVDVSAVASIYSPSVEFEFPLGFFNITIEAEAYIGGIGGGLELDSDTGKIKITPLFVGVGGSYGVDFDLVS